MKNIHLVEIDCGRLARLAYYICSNPMQYGSSARYSDWLSSIEDILLSLGFRATKDQLEQIAASDVNNRLHNKETV